AGCPKRAPVPDPTDDGPVITAPMPDTAPARRVARQLLDARLSGPHLVGDAELGLDTLIFAPDGTWQAEVYEELGGDRVGCEERGAWSIQAMEGDAAVVDLVLRWSTCPGREAGEHGRVLLEPLGGGRWRTAPR